MACPLISGGSEAGFRSISPRDSFQLAVSHRKLPSCSLGPSNMSPRLRFHRGTLAAGQALSVTTSFPKRMPSSGSGFLATEQTQSQSSHLGERSPPAKGPGSDNKQRGGEGFQEGPSPQELATCPQTPVYFSFHSASPLPLQMGFITPIFLQGLNWLKPCNLVPRGWDLFYRNEVMQNARQREFCNIRREWLQ